MKRREQEQDNAEYSDVEIENDEVLDLKRAMQGIENEMRKALQSKKKQASILSKNYEAKREKLDSNLAENSSNRTKLASEFTKQMNSFINQIEVELEGYMEEEKKLSSFLKQRADHVKECHAVQSQRIKKIRMLQEQFQTSYEKLEKQQLNCIKEQAKELDNEMKTMKTKMIKDSVSCIDMFC
ncbi:MAG: Synaptonemal complex protein 3 [Marteilia pararefringens]